MAAINSSKAYFEIGGTSAALASGGTVSSSGTTLTGSGTDFSADLVVGDAIQANGTTDVLIVTAIASGTSLTVHKAPSNAMSGATVNKFPFTQVQAAFDGSGPSLEASEIDVTTWDTSGYREKIPGLIDSGSFECTVYFQPQLTSHQGLIDDLDSGVQRPWRIWYPDSSSSADPPAVSNSRFTFAGAVSNFSTTVSADSAVEASLRVTITGKPILTPGS